MASPATLCFTVDERSLGLRDGSVPAIASVSLPALPKDDEFSLDLQFLELFPRLANTPDNAEKQALLEHLAQAGTPEQLARRLGGRLFDLLMPDGPIRKAYRRARDNGDGLRPALEFVLEQGKAESAVNGWAALPWEFLCDPDKHDFVARRPATTVARRLGGLPLTAPPPAAPLSVLALLAEPWTHSPYRRDAALAGLTSELAGDNVAVLHQEQPTFVSLILGLTERKPAVLHVVAHGFYDQENGGGLALEDEYGGAHIVSAREFAREVSGAGLALVALASCDSASGEGVRGLPSVAHALLRAGIHAVVAMQYAAPVESTNRFMGQLYRALSRGAPLDEAVQLARRTIASSPQSDTLDWAIPVLYMQADRWEVGEGHPSAQPEPPEKGPAPSNLTSVERPPANFVGRGDDMISLARALRHSDRPRRFVTVTGMGGIGKTAAGLENAWWHLERGCFPDGVFWASAKGVPTYPQLLSAIGNALGLADSAP